MNAREEDPGRLAEELDQEADRLERDSSRLQHRVDEVRADWERKRSDQNVPGAPSPPAEESEEQERPAGSPPDKRE